MRAAFIALILIASLHAQDTPPPPPAPAANRSTADLEAEVERNLLTTPAGAKAMLELIAHYDANGQIFGLIRTAKKFASAQSAHPQHKHVVLQLLGAYQITSRDADLIADARQFLTRHPDAPESAKAERLMAAALERTGNRLQAAQGYQNVWKKLGGGGISDALSAIELFLGINQQVAHEGVATIADQLIEQLPPRPAAEVAWQGAHAARRYQNWTLSNSIANRIISKNLPIGKQREPGLHFLIAENHEAQGQYTNAISHFEKSLAERPDATTSRRLINAHAHTKADPSSWLKLVSEHLKNFPDDPERYTTMAQLAYAFQEAKNTDKAIEVAARLLPVSVGNASFPSHFVSWSDNHQRSEQILKDAIAKNQTADAWRLRWVLAFNVYRDGLKDIPKAKATARELLFDHPANDGTLGGALGWLLENATDEKEFQSDVARFLKSARQHIEYKNYRSLLSTWSEAAVRNEPLKARGKSAREQWKNFDNDNFTKNWVDGERDHQHGRKGRDWLLGQNLTNAQRSAVLTRQGNSWRHHSGDKERANSIPYFKQAAQLGPADHDHAARWLDAAAHYGDPAEAAAHMLKVKPVANYYTWRSLLHAAEKTKDPALAKRAHQWITTSQKTPSLDYASEIGERLFKLGLEAEGRAYWQERIPVDRNHAESAGCAGKLHNALPENQREAFVKQLMEPDTDFHGAYACWLADLYFKAGDLNKLESTIQDARRRQDARPFRAWNASEWPAQSWLDAVNANTDKKFTEPQRDQVYRAVQSLRIGRTSASAALSLLARSDTPTSSERLRAYRNALHDIDSSSYAWDRVWPHSQALMARQQFPEATILLTAMLQQITNVDDNRKNGARAAIRKAYASMGALGFDIDDDSPVAPLLQIGLHLRLGDRQLATETYNTNRPLFDAHRLELPVEILAFAVGIHIEEGGDANYERVEDILRSWLVKFSEDAKVPDTDKARIQLLIAQNYAAAGRYEVARSEFTTVTNRYPKTPEATDAQFGIGETYMAQKIYDKSEEIFAALAEAGSAKTTLRADFLRGVLASKRGDRDEARDIFRTVLSRMPDVTLADQALYQLSEVYGYEQRYMDQLELLRTVGRLGRESKRWHTPGLALSIVIQDTDLGISRGHSRIPVLVKTQPGGDIETVFLTSGGAGKGLFMAEIPTTLGNEIPDDSTLQVTGGDTITVDYPEEFKKEFSYELPANSNISISSDGKFAMASARIEDEDEESLSSALEREAIEEAEGPVDQRKSIVRPASQIKPGNPIYMRVTDHDRNLSDAQDEVLIKITASSGDLVGATLTETGAHTGIFEGSITTGELPAGALATDSSIDHSPLMAIDRDPETAWISEPDGAAPKSLTVDMKDLYAVDTAVLHASEPVRTQVTGSHDGRFWYPITTTAAEPLPAKFGPMTQRTFATAPGELQNWKQVAEFVKAQKPTSETQPESLTFTPEPPAEGQPAAAAAAILWQGKFHQPRDGAVRFEIKAADGAIFIAGHATVGLTADAYLRAGMHDLAIFAAGTGTLSATRAHENPNSASVTLVPFSATDFASEGENITPATTEFSQEPGKLTYKIPPTQLRYLQFTFDEYKGESVAVKHIEISGGGKTHIPTEADILALAKNDILEIAAGDTVTGTYIDAVTAGGLQRNKALSQSLTATYYNGVILPISYDFVRAGNGSVNEIRKELLRIDPGERITIEVADFDMDATGTEDSVEVQVQVNNAEAKTLTATETGPTTGIFKTQIDTKPEELAVKPGDTIYLRYRDPQNTFPGHAATREERVFVRTPTEGKIRIVETRVQRSEAPEGSGNTASRADSSPTVIYLPQRDTDLKGVAFEAPLTVEVIDPDSAKDSRSQVIVELKTIEGDPIQVACQISSAHGPADPALADERNPALFQGRFVGQVLMRLGGPESPKAIPLTEDLPGGLIGKVITPEDAEDEMPEDTALVRVLNLTGKDITTATYLEQASQEKPSDQARLIADGNIAITTQDYEDPAEILFLGERLFLRVEDPDLDISAGRDIAIVQITTGTGESESVELEETLTHSGIFTASFALPATPKPTRDNGKIEGFFGDTLIAGYLDQNPASQDSQLVLKQEIPIAEGTDGIIAAFSKIFGDEDLAIQTQFHIAESYFELFKSHLALEREQEATADLNAGRKVLRELSEDYPDPKYAPRVAYLLGQFSQELKEWSDAIQAYKTIVRDFPEHTLAADAQYKLGQCYEKAGEFDAALDAYVALAATYPDSPLIASVMMRINEHFYIGENYAIAAKVAEKFVEKFPTHQHAARMAFRIGQSYHKDEDYTKAGESFDQFMKSFPDDDLSPQALFWGGESYRLARNVPLAFRRYNRCRWDFPETEAAKFARGRLALPEFLAQFEREANLDDE